MRGSSLQGLRSMPAPARHGRRATRQPTASPSLPLSHAPPLRKLHVAALGGMHPLIACRPTVRYAMAAELGMAVPQRSRICSRSSYICTDADRAREWQPGQLQRIVLRWHAAAHQQPGCRTASRCARRVARGRSAQAGAAGQHGTLRSPSRPHTGLRTCSVVGPDPIGCSGGPAAVAATAAAAAAAAAEAPEVVRTAAISGGAVGEGSMPCAASRARSRCSSDSSQANFSFCLSLAGASKGEGARRRTGSR